MDLFAFFCYITVTCDAPATSAPATSAPAVASPLNRPPNGNQNSVSNGDGRKNVRETSTYPTRYDYIDVETVMNNERIIKILFNCVVNRGPCTREGLELKRIIPDAIQTECAKCNDRQRKQAGKALAYLLTYKPEYWRMLIQKFDPNNVYLRKYMSDNDEEKVLTQNPVNDTTTSKN